MRRVKKTRLESKGCRVGDAADLLELAPEEAAFVDAKLALAERLPARPSAGRCILASGCAGCARGETMTVPRDDSYIWVTWITGLMSADRQCEWAAWFRAHFQGFDKVPSTFDLAAWKAAHGEMVRERADELRGEGYTVYVEGQNKFTLRGKAATLGGVPDLVAVRGGEGLVVDCKSGKQRDSDAFQVLTYMLVLPLTHEACRHLSLAGEVQYRDSRLPIAPEKLTDELKGLIRATIERVGGDAPAARVPSAGECRFCDITAADCPERVDEEREVAEVEHDLF